MTLARRQYLAAVNHEAVLAAERMELIAARNRAQRDGRHDDAAAHTCALLDAYNELAIAAAEVEEARGAYEDVLRAE